MIRVVIVGGGASGRLAALHLVRRAPTDVDLRIRMVDRRGPDSMGPAYSTDADTLLLNVPAEIMGASSEDPDEFRRWAAGRWEDTQPGAYLPRRLFREYLLGLLAGAVADRRDEVTFEHVQGAATDLEVGGSEVTIRLDGGETLEADRVVLALGNPPPPDLPMSDPGTRESERYVSAPWDLSPLDRLAPDDPVIFIGTGQTMVDLSLVLTDRGHGGTLTAMSRRGLLPLTHPEGDQVYPSFFDEIEGSTSIRHVLATVRKHVRRARSAGLDPRSVIDSMRTDTQALWSGMPEVEKRRFMRHAFRYWERIRSRIPPESGATIDRLRADGRLRVRAGRIRDIVDVGSAMEVRYSPRRGGADRTERAAMVINCIGPEADYRRVRDPLVRNLLDRGLIQPGMADIGLATDLAGAVLDADGVPSEVLFTLGSTMKGLVWEALAVPDIRVQAEELAEAFLRAAEPGGPPEGAAHRPSGRRSRSNRAPRAR
ncbi:MAG: FAD/NAD(P)-binding protein [Gemmatimonadota bacterium]|jgi:uncharacterized NAD(P)/FAD-binding protein YdhS